MIKLITFITAIICFPLICVSATIYVDQNETDCADYDHEAAESSRCGAGSEQMYDTIQEAVTNCTAGDTIYMRGDTYLEINIDPPESKNGSEGSPTTLASYPGEWAIIDGTGLGTSNDWEDQAVFSHPPGYETKTSDDYTEWWVFERFEVTGGRSGMFFKTKNVVFRYLYVHDNGRDFGDTIMAGIYLSIPQDTTIEFNRFEDNDRPTSSNNDANLMFDTDIKDVSDPYGSNGGVFDEAASLKGNIIRYNYSIGGARGLRTKHQQRFGYNDRNPTSEAFMAYEDWGNKYHHNIVVDTDTDSIVVGADFDQVYNNITDNQIEATQTGDVPIIWNNVLYNNTIVGGHTIQVSGGYSTSLDNYYYDYDDANRMIHPHVWIYNNITTDTSGDMEFDPPISIAYGIERDTAYHSGADSVVDRNVGNNNTASYGGVNGFIRIFNQDSTGCDFRYQTVATFNSCSDTWRSTSGVLNWQPSLAYTSLFQDSASSGTPEEFKTIGSAVVGATTIANGGADIAHPYLSGVTIPDYVGATNPDDNDWVAGVLGMDVTYFTSVTAGAEPSWVEGYQHTGSTPSGTGAFQ